MKTIKIGKDRELLFNVRAIQEIKKKFGSLEAMEKAITKEDPVECIDEIAEIITILVNAGILRKNADIDLGLAQGEKDKLLTAEVVATYLDMETINGFGGLFADVLNGGYESDIPQTEEKDEVLKEIDAKNA